ncbi:CU044_5270 family protein [Streptomyces fildesensis]|uniref:CU044_5270 family protein n=1 Tax=Streptomyces fildesensis TaxID=375757 RepID=A0ABW8C606_9ACTN
MNPDFRKQPEPCERTQSQQKAQVLPAPPYTDMAPDRHRVLKDHLMREIDHHGRTSPHRGTFRPTRRMVLTWVAAGAAGTAAVTAGVGALRPEPAELAAPASAASVHLLEQAALAATTRPEPSARTEQFTFVQVVGHTMALSEGMNGAMDLQRVDEAMEQWTSVDGSGRTLQRTARGDELLPDAPGAGNLNSPTYGFLAKLPTDPDALLKRIYADTDLNHGSGSGSTTGPDQEAFVAIGDLLRDSVAPASVSAGLYRAAARIPGVIAVPDSIDAAGRHGVAVARENNGERKEWIFDKNSMRLLGERTVLLKDSPWGKAGEEVTSIAVMRRGIVDKVGQLPDPSAASRERDAGRSAA